MYNWKKEEVSRRIENVDHEYNILGIKPQGFLIAGFSSIISAKVFGLYFFFLAPLLVFTFARIFWTSDVKRKSLEYSRKFKFLFKHSIVSDLWGGIPQLIVHEKKNYRCSKRDEILYR